MEGELRPPPPPPESELQKPTRPLCARLCLSALGKLAIVNSSSSAEEVDIIFDTANDIFVESIEQAPNATEDDCASCLEGKGLRCPLKETPVELSDTLRNLRHLSPIPARRIEKVLERGGSAKITPMDYTLKTELHTLGFEQDGDKSIKPIEESNPIPVVPDPRNPRRRMQEVVDTEPEPRPLCASALNQFYTERANTIQTWEDTDLRKVKDPSRRRPIDHSSNERTYARAIELTAMADPEKDCALCIEDCPPKHKVPPKVAYDQTHRTSKLPNGEVVRTSDIMQLILQGLPRDRIVGPPDPTEVLVKINSKLQRIAEEHGGKYLPEAS